jgi:DNA-binding LacI/PurR family transcriptional regulator
LEIGTHQDNMDDKVNRGRARVCPPGTAHPRAVFTADDVMAIRAIAGTMTRKMIAKKYGVSRSAVDSVITGRTYRDIS